MDNEEIESLAKSPVARARRSGSVRHSPRLKSKVLNKMSDDISDEKNKKPTPSLVKADNSDNSSEAQKQPTPISVKRRNPTPPRIRTTDAPRIGLFATADSGISSDEQIPAASQGVILNSSTYLENGADTNQQLSSSRVASLLNKVRDAHMRNISNAASKKDPIISSDDEDISDSPTPPSKAKPSNYSHFDSLREWGLKATKAIIYVICAPFLLCCDLIYSGCNLVTSLITSLSLSMKWPSLKDTWSRYSKYRIPVVLPRTHKKALKFGSLLIFLSLLVLLLHMLKDHMSTNPLAELWLKLYVIISSMFSVIWSCLAGYSKNAMEFVDSTYYHIKTGVYPSGDDSNVVDEGALFQNQHDFKIQFETTLDLLLRNEKFAQRIKEWSSMDNARLDEVVNRIQVQENALTSLMHEHKHQVDDRQREIIEKLELTKTDTHEKLSLLSNSQFPSIQSQINSIEQTLKTEESNEHSIFETLQSEITDIQHQITQLKESQGNDSEIAHHRKSDVLLKLEDFEARLNTIVSEQAQLSKTISDCSNTVDSLDISDGSLLKKRIDQVINDIFDKHLSDSADPTHSKLKRYVSQLNSLILDDKDMLTKDQLQVQLSETFATWKKQVLDEIKPQISNSDVTQNKQLWETIESELNNILERHKTTIKDEHVAQVGDLAQFSEEEVSRIIKTELVTYDADKTGKFDFALESAGGTIVSTRCTQTYDAATAVYSIWGIPIWWESVNGPRAILQPGANPGQCWAVKGDGTGVSAPPISVVIELSDKITVDSVTLEHIPETLSPDGNIKSAPKEFSVLGLSELNDSNPVVLGNFTYVIGRRPVQTFKIASSEEKDKNPANKYFSLIELKVHSNYGNPIYTCIYRFRVHGYLTPEAKTNFR